MSIYFKCDADLNIPIPCAEHLAYKVRAMYDGKSPVTARDIAMFYGVAQSAIICAMRRSESIHLVRRVSERAWVPIITS
jgi:hypothetical protein